MSATSFIPKFAFAVAAVVACGLGLTTYTQPIVAPVQDQLVITLLRRALGDTVAPLPGPPSALSIRPLTEAAASPDPRRSQPPSPETTLMAPDNWAAARAAADSAALRAWLIRPAVSTASLRGDTLRTTLRRLTFRAGCPLRQSFVVGRNALNRSAARDRQ